MVSVEVKDAWNKRFSEVSKRVFKTRVLTGFNCNVDYVKFVDCKKLEELVAGLTDAEKKLVLHESGVDVSVVVNNRVVFLSVLVKGMRSGKSVHVLGTQSVFTWMEEFFGGPDEKCIGGQAGITATQLNSLGFDVVLSPSLLSREQAELLAPEINVPVVKGKKLAVESVRKAFRPLDETKINWIFEFKRGDVLKIGGVTVTAPRANRVIIASEAKENPWFAPELEKFLPDLGARIDVALLSGFHYLTAGKELPKQLKLIETQLALLKKKNKKLLLHYEYVPPGHKEVEKKLLLSLCKHVDSMGLNETELIEVLKMLGKHSEAEFLRKHESAYSICQGMRKLMSVTGLKRLQVHDLGFHTVLLKKPNYAVPVDRVRDACVYASFITSLKARLGLHFVARKDVESAEPFVVSETGLNQISIFESAIAKELMTSRKVKHSSFDRRKYFAEGILELKDVFVIIVPAPIVPVPKLTVGLGDVFSSTFLAAERG